MAKNETMDVEKLAITVPEAGKMIGLGKSASYEAAHSGLIPTMKAGRRLIVPLAAFRKKFECSGESEVV